MSIIKYFNNNTVSKTITKYIDKNIFEREVYWLAYLNEKKYKWCPKIYSFNKLTKTIVMEYVGVPINKTNAPKNWDKQLYKILQDLKNEGLYHNDIKCSEVLVKKDSIYLIDYGWMSYGPATYTNKIHYPNCIKPDIKIPDNTCILRIHKILTAKI
jgi:tRNA A-37 threonylcarbamoyl transferase component Bud32